MAETTFPISLPNSPILRVQRCKFDLQRYDEGTFFKRGVGQVVEYAAPRWKVAVTSTPSPNVSLHSIHAWWESLRGQMGTFLSYDFSNPYPQTYPTGNFPALRFDSSPFDGTCSVTAYPNGGYTISLSNLPNPFTLKVGDWFGLKEGNKYSLHKVTEDRTSTAGGAITIMAITPRVLINVFTTGATVKFAKPLGKFQAVPNSLDWEPQVEQSPIKFEGIGVYK